VAPPYEKSVFINCPYDDEFAPLFAAIVLTVAALGFTPRSARETAGEGDPRIVRIARGLMSSKYSIHDLTRFQGEGVENLARFNMPLELGMALAVRFMRDGSQIAHNWVALVPQGLVHQTFVSDLAGYDLRDHDSRPPTVIRRVAGWLTEQPDFEAPAPTAKTILDAYQGFMASLAQAKQHSLGELTWPAVVKSVQIAVTGMPVVA
jgi:hypothetical protein